MNELAAHIVELLLVGVVFLQLFPFMFSQYTNDYCKFSERHSPFFSFKFDRCQ